MEQKTNFKFRILFQEVDGGKFKSDRRINRGKGYEIIDPGTLWAAHWVIHDHTTHIDYPLKTLWDKDMTLVCVEDDIMITILEVE